MINRSSWSRTVKEWISIQPKSHRFGYPMLDTFPHGVPIGGFGAGTIGIAPSGKWNCFHLDPGKHCFMADSQSGFSFSYEFLSKEMPLNYEDALYSALYPLARWDFDIESSSSVRFLQYTPVIMDEYQYTSYPVGGFKLEVTNNESQELKLKVKFDLVDILGRKYDRIIDEPDKLYYRFLNPEGDLKLEVSDESIVGSKQVQGKQIERFGLFCSQKITADVSNLKGTVVFSEVIVAPGEKKIVDFVFVWDLPQFEFVNDQILRRKYTEFFDNDENRLRTIAQDVLENNEGLLSRIDAWQKKVWDKHEYSDQIKSLMINELYYLAHGGTLWEADTNNFGYLECIDYPYYETLDVRFYSSWALLAGWPKLENQVMRQFADTINQEDRTIIDFNSGYLAHQSVSKVKSIKDDDEKIGFRKRKGACPHDLGSFEENPFLMSNAYCFQNPNRWKDLNPKFILMVYRNYFYTQDDDFLKYCWPAVKEAYEYFKIFDVDGDGLPENEGWPDQTYDCWTMKGTSAYCSLLWLAAVECYQKMAELLNDELTDSSAILQKGIKALEEKLWNGTYFDYDQTLKDVMADQLAGQWYLRFCGLDLLVSKEREDSVLDKIYEHNFVDFAGMKYGMVNGRTPEGGDVFTPQGNDSWLGTNYGIASYYHKVGRAKQGDAILSSLERYLYEDGMAFRSPESVAGDGRYIAQLYMRPQAIWALHFV